MRKVILKFSDNHSKILKININFILFFILGNWGPHLIIVPTSVMLNWEMEFKKWCPAFKILTYYGTQKERKHKRAGKLHEQTIQVFLPFL